MNNLVSIVLASYNGAKYLPLQLDSIQNQTYENFELIVVDDSSSDETLSILEQYAAKDDRIHIYRAEKNLGLIANFERGLKLACGEFIALADQDDIFLPEKLELLVNKLEEFPHRDLVVSDLSLIDSVGNEIAGSMWSHQRLNPSEGKPFRRLLYSNFATGCAMMFRRRLLKMALPFPEDVLVHDWWLALVAASKNAGGICLIHKPLIAYRQHEDNLIGIKPVFSIKNLTIKKIMKRINAKSSDSRLRERERDWRPHIARVHSYLTRDIWTASEKKYIQQIEQMFLGYLADGQRGLFKRLLCLPLRLYYTALTKRVTSCLAVVFVTLFPNK